MRELITALLLLHRIGQQSHEGLFTVWLAAFQITQPHLGFTLPLKSYRQLRRFSLLRYFSKILKFDLFKRHFSGPLQFQYINKSMFVNLVVHKCAEIEEDLVQIIH